MIFVGGYADVLDTRVSAPPESRGPFCVTLVPEKPFRLPWSSASERRHRRLCRQRSLRTAAHAAYAESATFRSRPKHSGKIYERDGDVAYDGGRSHFQVDHRNG